MLDDVKPARECHAEAPTNGDGGGELDQRESGGHTGALLKLGARDHFRDLS